MRAIRIFLLTLLIIGMAIPQTRVQAADEDDLIEEIEAYTHLLPTLYEMDQILNLECQCQYSVYPSVKMVKRGILVRSLFVAPCSADHYEAILLFAPRNFRPGEGTTMINHPYRLTSTVKVIGDWSTIMKLDFADPVLMFTRHNAWVMVRSWRNDSQVDDGERIENLNAIAKAIERKLPASFLPLEVPDLSKVVSDDSGSELIDDEFNWKEKIWFQLFDNTQGATTEKDFFVDHGVDYHFYSIWQTTSDMELMVNDTQTGAIVLELPSDQFGKILLINTGGYPQANTLMQAWVIEDDGQGVDKIIRVLPEEDTEMLRYLQVDQHHLFEFNFSPEVTVAEPKFLIIHDGKLVVIKQYSRAVNVHYGE